MGFFFVSPFAFVCNEMIKKELNGVSFVKKQNIKEEVSEIPRKFYNYLGYLNLFGNHFVSI